MKYVVSSLKMPHVHRASKSTGARERRSQKKKIRMAEKNREREKKQKQNKTKKTFKKILRKRKEGKEGT